SPHPRHRRRLRIRGPPLTRLPTVPLRDTPGPGRTRGSSASISKPPASNRRRRIVTAAFVESATEVRTWLVDPGIEIPEAARAVHGITTEYAQANGAEARQGVTELCEIFSALKDAGAFVVGHIIVYDLSV